MRTSTRRNLALLIAAWMSVAAGPSLSASDFVGIRQADELHILSVSTGTASFVGNLSSLLLSPLSQIDRGPGGVLYATVPVLPIGYVVVSIDELGLTMAQQHFVGVLSDGEVGLAVDPQGNAVWVASKLPSTQIVRLRRVDLATGAVTEHGNLVGTHWGLGFGADGKLYTMRQCAGVAQLVRVNPFDAANSVSVGPCLHSVDTSMGLDLASSWSGGPLHLYSTSTAYIYSIDTTLGSANYVTAMVNAAGMRTFAATPKCVGGITSFGVGCPGGIGFAPGLAATGTPAVGSSLTVDIANGLGGSTAIVVFGLGEGYAPLGYDCSLVVSPPLPIQLPVPLSGVGAWDGQASFGAPIPAVIGGMTFSMQAFVIDPGVPLGFSATNGVLVTVP